MATVSGIVCDYCNKLETSTNGSKPEGWMRLTSTVETSTQDHFDLCSDRCLMILAGERILAKGETIPASSTIQKNFANGARSK